MRGESVNQGGLLRLYSFNVYTLTIYFTFDLKIKALYCADDENNAAYI